MLELNRWVRTALVVVLFVLTGGVAYADGPIDAKAVPDPLKPWTAWALHGKEDALCPTLHGIAAGTPQCTWPARLDLVLDEKKGTFTQAWHLDARRWVPLPGDDKRWPLDVKVGDARAVVVVHDGVPSVELDKGDHVVTGSFAWDSLPESLQVPQQTALLSLVLRGKKIEEPNRDAKGTVWLQKTLTAEEGERLDFVVHRRVVDEVPLILTTRIVLNVAGRNREVVLGKALPPGFVPMSIESQLPTRVEPDSRLRVQARPGTWTIELVARSEGIVNELARPNPDGPWRDGDEVWVFDARPQLRLVDVTGITAIDPQQTSLPEDWKRLPAYPLKVGDKLTLVEKRRGNAEPPPDHLTLSRMLWLDYDGAGFTAIDTLRGNLRRASRLEALPPTVLGRVSIGGKDQFITHLDGDAAKTGVEVRQGELSVSADSRIVADPSDMPAVGWNHDFHEVNATLNLPPGFRLVHATGVDDVPSTWFKHWTLLELFLALVLSIAVFRLHGKVAGAIALVTFILVFPEPGAPKYVLVFVVAAEAIVRGLDAAMKRVDPVTGSERPRGRGLIAARSFAGAARGAAATLLVLVALPFLVDHVRHGLFPTLAAEPFTSSLDVIDFAARKAPLGGMHAQTVEPTQDAALAANKAGEDVNERTASKYERAGDGQAAARMLESPTSTPVDLNKDGRRSSSGLAYKQFNAEVYDPSSMVQTGPGRPRWQFTQVPLHWSGPVERAQRLHLYLLGPTANAVLAIVRALLVLYLVWKLLPVKPRLTRLRGGTTALAFTTFAFVLLVGKSASAQSVPPNEVLEDLASRLMQKPSCAPTCASSSRMMIEAHPGVLRLRLEIEASAPTAIPLPNSAQWSPETVLVDGKPARSLLRTEDGKVWLAVEKGWHQATLEGPLPERELVQLALPLKPHRVETQADGWRVEGIHEDGLADDNVQLTRIRGKGGNATLEPGTLPPFVRVQRTILIGLDWQVETHVVRLSPPGTAIVLEVPLLKGESVTTADVRVSAGKALLNMPPNVLETTWRSVLDPKSPLVLTAPKATGWIETWRLDLSPIWHVDIAGVPAVQDDQQSMLPEWRPWPGETATLSITRPDGVQGRTLTIDESNYEVRPGLRATDATLTLQIRSSRGAQHTVTLPEGAELDSVFINGTRSSLRLEGRKLTLPIAPGSQSVAIAFRLHEGIGLFFRAPPIDLGGPSVNATTSITMPSRWTLFTSGPRTGPVVLFWSTLAILCVVAFGIGAMKKTPLAARHWMLLAIGLSQIDVVAAALVVGWFHLLGWRERATDLAPRRFNLRQVAIVLLTATSLVVLLVAVQQGLLGQPNMQVRGNGSTAACLRWFSDRNESILASPLVVSAPMLVYRGLMLLWSLWLAISLLRWLRWGWSAFGTGGFWRRPPPPPPPATLPHRTPAPPNEEPPAPTKEVDQIA